MKSNDERIDSNEDENEEYQIFKQQYLAEKQRKDIECAKLLQPKLKESIDKLFELFSDNLELFELIINKCVNVNKYDLKEKQYMSPSDIKYFIQNYIGNTVENAPKITQTSTPIFILTEAVYTYIPSISHLNLNYVESYSIELLGKED